MRVQLISKPEWGMTGISRYTKGLYDGLQDAGLDVRLTFPMRTSIPRGVQRSLKRVGVDLESFFASYPFRVDIYDTDIYHLTGQMLSTLLFFQRFPRPVVVSVMDIIPLLVQRVPELNTFRHPMDFLFYRLALVGLRRADALVAISEYTKQTLVQALKVPVERIHVVYPVVDHDKFRAMAVSPAFYTKYGLDGATQYILYVGSEDPRKNLATVIRAFNQVKQQIPGVKLLKVGASQFARERKRMLSLIDALDLRRDVLLMDYVQEEDLPHFYNAAQMCVLASLYEGFGLPVAEAMACGTPVISARAGPLPEVVGNGGIQVNPTDIDALANAMLRLLKSRDEHTRLRRAGQAQAAQFTSQRSACETQKLYQRLMGQCHHG